MWVCLCFGNRDPFAIAEQQVGWCDLQKMIPEELHFLGVVLGGHSENYVLGFIEDSLGQICQIKIGQRLGVKHMEVMNITSDHIVLSDGQRYLILE